MRRVTKVLLPAIIVVAGFTLWGCNRELDDPTQANGILSIESIEPVVIQADITPTDPNTGLATPLGTDILTVTLKNRPRTKSSTTSGGFDDIFVEKSERVCTFGGNRIAGGTGLAGVMIPSGSTADVPTDGVTLSEKTNTGATVGDFWKCDVRFLGHDLAGNPVATPVVSYAVDFVDK